MNVFSQDDYELMIQGLFNRFPSFQKIGTGAYKPGIANMEFADRLMGHPHREYKIIHVAGTNGKGSVSNMLASVLAGAGLKVGLYTSPHILDFRERMRVIGQRPDEAEDLSGESGSMAHCITKEYVYDFVTRWKDTFEHLDMSFFEITTLMALDWFASRKVDVVVLETGLGGRLDSTNIVTPVLSIITNIGLDHCDLLGETLPEIAFEKAGIIKPGVPVVVGESHPETDPVFERKAKSLLVFADKVEPSLWDRHAEILEDMDLQGAYQEKNLRTVLVALDILYKVLPDFSGPHSRAVGDSGIASEDSSCRNVRPDEEYVTDAILHTAVRTGFRGRWEKISDCPCVICDIGHNAHGLEYNFAQLQRMKDEGKCSDLIIVYGSVADKDVDAVLHLMPGDAVYVFTQARSRRALPSDVILEKYQDFCRSEGRPECSVFSVPDVVDALDMAKELACNMISGRSGSKPLIYVGGSTYVVSEVLASL